MKPAYRPPPLIYRGTRHKTVEGACPVCGKAVTLNKNGCRRTHRDSNGLCPGSGVKVADSTAAPLDMSKVLAALPQHAPVRLEVAPLERHASSAERRKHPARCPECGQNPRVASDGTLQAHRTEPFIGPYCPGGAQKGRP